MSLDPFRKALILTGPTGSGKTEVGIELARRLGAEIVAMDSMTLYRGMDVGTAKPSREERAKVRHHLVDVLDPWEGASVAWWLARAGECCLDIEKRGKKAIVVGGTPLYLKALFRGLFEGPASDVDLRERLAEEARQAGSHSLHERLARIDPATACRLHSNDLRRVIRALEVWELTGKPMSYWQTQWRSGQPSTGAEDGRPRCLCLDLPRAELYARIDARVRKMFEHGLVAEVERLRGLARPLSREAKQGLGYKEVFEHLDGRYTLEETVVRVQTRTRNFAKRQMTWFRHMGECLPASKELTFSAWGATIEGHGVTGLA